MRAALNKVDLINGTSHAGLVLEKCANFQSATGKLEDDAKRPFIDSVCKCASEPYRRFFTRWKESLESTHTIVEVRATSRIAIGLGNHSPLENGLTLHHTYGTPVLPGSSLKGVLNHWMLASADADFQSRREVVFGYSKEDSEQSAKGYVTFEDALYIPDSAAGGPLAPDVLTPHHKNYYSGNIPLPNDWEDPDPHAFVSIRPGARFLVAVTGEGGWALWALTELLAALEHWGIGAKTSAGYGRLKQSGKWTLSRYDAPHGPSATASIDNRRKLEKERREAGAKERADRLAERVSAEKEAARAERQRKEEERLEAEARVQAARANEVVALAQRLEQMQLEDRLEQLVERAKHTNLKDTLERLKNCQDSAEHKICALVRILDKPRMPGALEAWEDDAVGSQWDPLKRHLQTARSIVEVRR